MLRAHKLKTSQDGLWYTIDLSDLICMTLRFYGHKWYMRINWKYPDVGPYAGDRLCIVGGYDKSLHEAVNTVERMWLNLLRADIPVIHTNFRCEVGIQGDGILLQVTHRSVVITWTCLGYNSQNVLDRPADLPRDDKEALSIIYDRLRAAYLATTE